MKTILAAAALAVALPAAAHAADQPKPGAPAATQGQAPSKPHKCCCEEMMKGNHGDHHKAMSGHEMSGHQGHDTAQHQQPK